ncbi:UNVERIFIED_ORG: hypothetical protein J2X79_004381 [Arthrobacter globiformis]|nr:hypothetical protein [Arthrobacter globiformis]
MTMAPNSYLPRDENQPRGKRPWSAECDTDLHLIIKSPAVPGRPAGSLPVAFRCSKR